MLDSLTDYRQGKPSRGVCACALLNTIQYNTGTMQSVTTLQHNTMNHRRCASAPSLSLAVTGRVCVQVPSPETSVENGSAEATKLMELSEEDIISAFNEGVNEEVNSSIRCGARIDVSIFMFVIYLFILCCV